MIDQTCDHMFPFSIILPCFSRFATPSRYSREDLRMRLSICGRSSGEKMGAQNKKRNFLYITPSRWTSCLYYLSHKRKSCKHIFILESWNLSFPCSSGPVPRRPRHIPETQKIIVYQAVDKASGKVIFRPGSVRRESLVAKIATRFPGLEVVGSLLHGNAEARFSGESILS